MSRFTEPSTVLTIRKCVLLQSRVRRVHRCARSQTEHTIVDLEACDAFTNFADCSNNIFGWDSRQLVGDQKTCVPASVIVRVKTWVSPSAQRWEMQT